MPRLKSALMMASAAAAALAASVWAQDNAQFSEAQISKGAAIYSQNCSPCHGPRMRDPDAAFDLRKLSPDQKPRFVLSVTKGKNQMPPWGDLFKSDEIEALWAYVMAGERQ
jgi:mono/diheme cytochrome c family protein